MKETVVDTLPLILKRYRISICLLDGAFELRWKPKTYGSVDLLRAIIRKAYKVFVGEFAFKETRA